MVKIFVGNLSESTTKEELHALFAEYGKISECDIVKNFGFVHMEEQSEAEEAIRNLHHQKLNGQEMNVELSKGRPKGGRSRGSTKLYVSNLSGECTNQELRAKFEEYGPVLECDIVKDYAFVHMEREDEALDAIKGLDNSAFQGKLMNVQLSTSRLRTVPGMGDHAGCYACGKPGHWSKDCPRGQNGGSYGGEGGGYRGGGGRGYPPGPPAYGRPGPGYGRPPGMMRVPPDYMSSPMYGRVAGYPGAPPPVSRYPGYGAPPRDYASDSRDPYAHARAMAYPPERPAASAYDRDRYSAATIDYYEKYRARPTYSSAYPDDRRLSIPPPPPPPSSALVSRMRLSSGLDPYDRSGAAAAAAMSSYAAVRDRSPIRRLPVSSYSAGVSSYSYERSRLSPVSRSSASAYAMPRSSDPYAKRPRYI